MKETLHIAHISQLMKLNNYGYNVHRYSVKE